MGQPYKKELSTNLGYEYEKAVAVLFMISLLSNFHFPQSCFHCGLRTNFPFKSEFEFHSKQSELLQILSLGRMTVKVQPVCLEKVERMDVGLGLIIQLSQEY
jgi:hypothetical protein